MLTLCPQTTSRPPSSLDGYPWPNWTMYPGGTVGDRPRDVTSGVSARHRPSLGAGQAEPGWLGLHLLCAPLSLGHSLRVWPPASIFTKLRAWGCSTLTRHATQALDKKGHRTMGRLELLLLGRARQARRGQVSVLPSEAAEAGCLHPPPPWVSGTCKAQSEGGGRGGAARARVMEQERAAPAGGLVGTDHPGRIPGPLGG